MIRMDNATFESHGEEMRGISFRIGEGEKSVVLGPRFSGKSDFLRVCSGAHPFFEGEVSLFGTRLDGRGKGLPENLIRSVGFVTRHSTLMDNLTVLANVGLPLAYHLGLSPKETAERVRPMLERFQISGAAQKFPHQITEAEAKLTMIARASVFAPKIIFLDEPTSGDLDPGSFIKIISSLKSPEMENMAMVITTSSPSVATLEGATAYYFVGGVLFRRAELPGMHSPEVADYLSQIKRYTERQRKDIPPFFADADSKGMGGTP